MCPSPNTEPLPDVQAKELMAKARKATELLKALSHETRLMVLCLLCEGEKSVSEIETVIDLPQAAVSQQLKAFILHRSSQSLKSHAHSAHL